MILAALGLVLTLIGGFGLASRILGQESPAGIRLGLAWPLGACAVAWCQLAALVVSVPVHPAVSLVPAALLCTLVRRGDLRGARPGVPTLIALAALVAVWIPALQSRLLTGFVDPDTLSIWARRALGYFELGRVWPDPALHAYSSYPHLVSLRILAVLAAGGTAAEPLARHASIFDAASIIVLLGAWAPHRVSRFLAFAAQAGVLLAYPLVSQTWTGMADLPLAAAMLGCGAVVLLPGSVEGGRAIFTAGLLGGVAAFTKHEGEAFAVAMAAAVTLFARRKLRALVTFCGAALLVALPEWAYRAAFRPAWSPGTGWPDWRRTEELLATIAASPAFASLALPAVATILLAALVARRPDEVAGRGVAAAAVGVAAFSVVQLLAVLGTIMLLSAQINSALDRLLCQTLPLAAAVLAAAASEITRRRSCEPPTART